MNSDHGTTMALLAKNEHTSCPMAELSAETHHEHGKCYNVTMDFISLLLAVGEISLVLYLSIHHFQDQMGVIAMAMLAPIALNFVGVTYFFSDKEERMEFERVGNSRCAKDIFQVPVLGPVFTALKVLLISSGISKENTNYERFEASAIKMRQAESFFGAAPEALIQLTVLLVSQERKLSIDSYLEILVVLVSVLTLSEANMYGVLSNYYKLFHDYQCGDWKLPHVTLGQKVVLFLHSFTSISTRIAATSCLKAAVKYCLFKTMEIGQTSRTDTPEAQHTPVTQTPMNNSPHTNIMENDVNILAFIVVSTFVIEMGVRMCLFYIARLIKYIYIGKGIPSGCYESINYGWRATILDFGFQSQNIFVQLWFYIENSIYFFLWWFMVTYYADTWVRDLPLSLLSSIFLFFTIFSMFLLFALKGMNLHNLKSPFPKPSV